MRGSAIASPQQRHQVTPGIWWTRTGRKVQELNELPEGVIDVEPGSEVGMGEKHGISVG